MVRLSEYAKYFIASKTNLDKVEESVEQAVSDFHINTTLVFFITSVVLKIGTQYSHKENEN